MLVVLNDYIDQIDLVFLHLPATGLLTDRTFLPLVGDLARPHTVSGLRRFKEILWPSEAEIEEFQLMNEKSQASFDSACWQHLPDFICVHRPDLLSRRVRRDVLHSSLLMK